MLTIRTIRMAYQPALKSMYLIKPVSVKACKQSLQTTLYINQRFAGDAKKTTGPAKDTARSSTSSSVSPKETDCSESKAGSSSPSDVSPKAASTSAAPPSASTSAAPPSASTSAAPQSASSAERKPPLKTESVSSSSSKELPSPSASPAEAKPSADTTKPIDIKLPSSEQVEKYFFRATVLVWDASVYLYCLAVKLFDQYVLKQPVVQKYWAIFQKEMDQARKEMKSK